MNRALEKMMQGNSSFDDVSNKNAVNKGNFIWLEKDKRFAIRVRFHVKKYYSSHSTSMSVFYRKYAELDEEGKQNVKDRFKAGEEFCLTDQETTKEIAAWYICFNEHIQYADQLFEKAKTAENEEQRRKQQKASIEKIITRWEQTYPFRLEERREAEMREKETTFSKLRKSIFACFGRQPHQQKSKEQWEEVLLTSSIFHIQ